MNDNLRLDRRSQLNVFLRRQASRVSPNNPLRRVAAWIWDRMLFRMGGNVTFAIHGHTVRLLSRFRTFNLDYERQTLARVLGLLRPGDEFWDVGANIGIFTLLAGQRVGPAGRVVSWEPTPATFEVLKEHLRLNNLENNCRTLNAAVNDGSGDSVEFSLDASDRLASTNRIASRPIPGNDQRIRVPAGALDSWSVRLNSQPRLIKLDIEGGEVLALRGANALMSGSVGSRPMFILAVHPQFLGEFGCQVEEIEQIINERAYTALAMDGCPTRPVEYAEYLLVPKESLESISLRR